ncbi:Alpha/Beta hydrolase protein [Coemansia spiralis]|nr:Alpha/Beta hydrolase protein [Coemansia spiralis]
MAEDMNNLTNIDTTVPVEAPDSPIWKHLVKRGSVDVSGSNVKTERPLNIYYEIYGNGPERVVFINGMGADRQMWEPNVAEFLKMGGYQCLVYDHRGTGYSDSGEGFLSYTTFTMATDLKNLLMALGWTKVNIIGVSMGGMIALEFACNHTELIKTLTLAVTNAGLSLPPLRGILDTVTANFNSDPRKRFEGICGSIYTEAYLKSPAPEGSGCETMLEYCAKNAVRKSRYSRPMTFMGFLGQVGTVFRHYVSPARLRTLGERLSDKQILIVTGDVDHLVRISNSQYLADKIGRDYVTLEIFEGAAHGLNSQEHEKFTRSIHTMISALNSK